MHYTREVWNTSSGLPQDTVRQFLQTADGYLWIATDGGLVRFDGADFTTYDRRNTPQMRSDLVNSLLEDKDGSLWVATPDGLLHHTAAGFTRYTTAEGLPSDSVVSVFEGQSGAQKGEVCVETAAGVSCLSARRFVPAPQAAPAAPHTAVRITASDGSIWTVTHSGLARLHRGASTAVPMPDGFTGADILTLYPDREGNLWVGSESSGAAILRQPPFAALDKRDGLAGDQVRSVFEDEQGGLWFGASAGLTELRDGRFTSFTVAQGLSSNQIIALAGSDRKDIWAGTPDGLSHLQGDRVTTLTASDGLPDDDIRSLLEARDHSLWIGTTHGLAHLQPGAGAPAIHTWTTADGLPSDVIGSLLEGADGSLWIGTRAGLAHLQNGHLQSYPSTIITALGFDAAGTLWIGTSGSGLYEFKAGRMLPAQARGSLPDTIYSILADRAGQLWIGSADGIYRVPAAQLLALAESPASAAQPAVTRYDVADGLRINDCSSGGHPEAIRTADGRLLFATSKGVAIVDPAEMGVQPSPPPIVLESILIDDAAANPAASLHVPAGHERVAFHYAGISFATPSKVRYRYQLAPFDRQWIDAGPRRTAYYTNIPPGRYRFQVQASTDGLFWSTIAAATELTIAPHYYQTWWFYTLLALAVALIVWQLYLYRVRQVELRFNAVLAERGRIAREIHDTLAQDIVAISVQLDLVGRLMSLSVEKARDQLAATRELVKKSLAEARSSIWDLRSQSATDLPTRLSEAIRQIAPDTAIKINLQITGTYRPAKRALEDELLRIAQEAVTNAVRHAEPQAIDVSLRYDAHDVELRVHDDGRGFVVQPSGPPGHYGIRGMHERAARAHARLSIESAPGAGTAVLARARI